MELIGRNRQNKTFEKCKISVDKWEYVWYNDIRNKENLWSGSNNIRIENMEVPQK